MSPRETVEIKVGLPDKEVVRELPLYTNLLRATIIILLIIFISGNITCLALFWLQSFGITNLSDAALGALSVVTLGEVAGLLTIILKKLL